MAIHESARLVRWATLLVLTISLLGTVMNSTGLIAGNLSDAAQVRAWSAFLPTIFIIFGIVFVERALAAIVNGGSVERALSLLLHRLGVCLFAGGIAFVFGQTLIAKMVLGSSPWAWFDIPAFALGCVGLLLTFLARLFRQAAAMRAELEEIL